MIALYSRVSTQEQTKGYSIGEQQNRLQLYCDALSLTPYSLYTDAGYSGGSTERPALKSLISDVKNGKIDKVIVYKLDRLSRSQKDTLELIEDVFLKNGCDFISVSENFDTATPLGRAMIGILAVFAQLEREQIKERMSIGKEARIKEGKWYGGKSAIGYSYKNDKLEIEPFEAMQIKEIYHDFLNGMSKYEILKTLRNKGYSHKYGNWNRTTLDHVLENNLYVGKLNLNGIEIQGNHEPIVSQDDFDSAQKLLAQREKKERIISKSYLGGLIWCKQCGSRIGVWKGGRKPNYYKYYKCYSRVSRNRFADTPTCTNKIYRMETLDEIVFNEIRKLKLDPARLAEPTQESTENQSALLEREIKRIDAQRSKLIDLYSFGNFTADELNGKIEPLTEQKNRLLEQLQAVEENVESFEKKKEMILSFDDVFRTANHHQIRMIVETLIEKIEIDGDDVFIYWNF